MKKLTTAAIGTAFALALACATAPTPPSNTVAARCADGASLDDSFTLPGAGGLSHTPAVVFTADGKRMLTATAESEVAIFDAATKKLLKRVKFPEQGTNGVSIDPSGRFVAWALHGGGLAVMDLDSEKLVARDATLQAKWLAVSPDSALVAVATERTVEVRELATLKLMHVDVRHDAVVTALAWSADGSMLASATTEGHLTVSCGTVYRYEFKKPAALYAIAFHPKGTAVAYGGLDKQVYQYEFAIEREEVVSRDQPYYITALGYSPDGAMLAVGDESCDIWLYRVRTKEMTFHNKHHNECWLSAVAWAPDNETFLFGCGPNTHAGKPTLHTPLARAEAARSRTARTSRAKLLSALDELIAKETDATKKEALVAYRKSMEGEEQPLGNTAVGNSFAITGATFGLASSAGPLTATSTGITWAGGASVQRVPPEVESLAREHEAVLEREMKTLAQNYCVNSWKAKK